VKALIAGTIVLALAAVAVLVFVGGATGGAVAFALFGVACVLGVSLVFLAVGRSEDAEREAEAPDDPHPRPALDRRRPMPPRRPS
jgi:UPF0716 family protein affecting phage T7 exclusion